MHEPKVAKAALEVLLVSDPPKPKDPSDTVRIEFDLEHRIEIAALDELIEERARAARPRDLEHPDATGIGDGGPDA